MRGNHFKFSCVKLNFARRSLLMIYAYFRHMAYVWTWKGKLEWTWTIQSVLPDVVRCATTGIWWFRLSWVECDESQAQQFKHKIFVSIFIRVWKILKFCFHFISSQHEISILTLFVVVDKIEILLRKSIFSPIQD